VIFVSAKNEKMKYHEHDPLPENLNDLGGVVSASESTGMMPTPPQNRSELHSYQDMAGMAIPKIAPGKEQRPEKRRTGRNSISKYFDNNPEL